MTGTISRAMNTAPLQTSTQTEAVRIVMTGCEKSAETRTICQLLLMMIMKTTRCAVEVNLTSEAIEPNLQSMDYFAVVLTQGLLQDPTFADLLFKVESMRKTAQVELRPILADPTFAFPGPEYYAELTAQKTQKGDTLVLAYRRMLNVIALGFNPMGSTGIMGTQVGEIIRRMKKTNDAATTYTVDAMPIDDSGPKKITMPGAAAPAPAAAPAATETTEVYC